MKKTLLAAGAVVALSTTFAAGAAENDKPQYLSDWWHQSVNVVGSYHTRFGPQIRNDTYLEYEAFAKKDWFDFYGYIDAPVFFGGNSTAKGIWNKGSPLFMEIEPRFSIDKLTNTDLSFGPFKEWYFANNYIYDMGRNDSQEQSTWYMGLGTDIDTGPANEPVAERLRQVPVAELRRVQRKRMGRLSLQSEILCAADRPVGRFAELHRLHQLRLGF